jgi:hypothetical protein
MDGWRFRQRDLMPQVSVHVLSQNAKNLSLLKEHLYLPSDYEQQQRHKLGLESLASIESSIREGVAFDTITNIQQHVKALDALLVHKRAHCRGQDQTTRSNAQITRVTAKRRLWIEHYNSNRDAMIKLGLPHAARSFPHLTVEDTFRVPPTTKRQLGDSQRLDGSIWSGGRPTYRYSGSSASVPQSLDSGVLPEIPTASTLSTRDQSTSLQHFQYPFSQVLITERKVNDNDDHAQGRAPTRGGGPQESRLGFGKTVSIADGWIWRLGMIGNLSEKEISDWEEEGAFASICFILRPLHCLLDNR